MSADQPAPEGEKTLGQIYAEASNAFLQGKSGDVIALYDAATEAGAAAVIAEYLRRNPAAAVAGEQEKLRLEMEAVAGYLDRNPAAAMWRELRAENEALRHAASIARYTLSEILSEDLNDKDEEIPKVLDILDKALLAKARPQPKQEGGAQ